jgi:hypothetical protein
MRHSQVTETSFQMQIRQLLFYLYNTVTKLYNSSNSLCQWNLYERDIEVKVQK